MASSVEATELFVRTLADVAMKNEKYFADLDGVCGDGDFGISLAAGFSKVMEQWESLDHSTPGALLKGVSMTIASRVGASMQAGNELVAAVPQLTEHASVAVEEVSRVGSSQITPAHWLTMAARVNQRFREDASLRGIVITHGTDTLEDTAYFLNLTVRDRRPVVITRNKAPSVVLLALEEYEAMAETLHLLRSPANARRLQKATADAAARRFVRSPRG